MRYEESAPSPRLRAVVEGRWTLTSDGELPPVDAGTVLPDGATEIVVSRGARVRAAPDGRPLSRFVLGPSDRPRRVHYCGPVDLVGVRLRPEASNALLGGRAVAAADRIVALTDVSRELDRRIACSRGRSASELLNAIERVLVSLAASARQPDSMLVRAVAEIRLRQGRVRIASLARHLGVGTRRLERRFVAEIGLPPKRFCRVVRFQAAINAMSSGDGRGWADLAVHLGYADQAHFSREFREFAGAPPTSAWWAHL